MQLAVGGATVPKRGWNNTARTAQAKTTSNAWINALGARYSEVNSGGVRVHGWSALVSSERENEAHCVDAARNGACVTMIRHQRKVPKLNKKPPQRKALLRGLTTQLLEHGRIKTTRARAKALRREVDWVITLAKKGREHDKRTVRIQVIILRSGSSTHLSVAGICWLLGILESLNVLII